MLSFSKCGIFLILNKKTAGQIVNKSKLEFFTQIGITILLCLIISCITAISIFGLSQYSLLLGLFGALTSIIFPFYFVYSAAGGSAIIIHSNHVSSFIAVFSALNFCVSFFTASFLTSLIFAENNNTTTSEQNVLAIKNICFNERKYASLFQPAPSIQDTKNYENTRGECNICLEENSNSSLLILETSLNKDEKKQLNNIKQNTPSNELLAALKNKDKICTKCYKKIKDFGHKNNTLISYTKSCPFTSQEVKKIYRIELDYENNTKIKHYTTKTHREYDNNGNVLLPLLNI